MKTRITLRLLCLGALGSLIVAASNCADQREPECTSPAAGHFPTRLTATNIPPGCEGQDLKAIVVATRSYYVLDGDGNVDYDEPFNVAIQTIEMGEQYIGLEDAAEFDAGGEEPVNRLAGGVSPESLIETNKLYAYGRFTTPRPDGNDQCYIPTTQAAVLESPGLVEVRVPVEDDPETPDVVEMEEIVPAEPAFRYEAQWSNITFLVSTAYPGVQFAGTLTYTRPYQAPENDPNPNPPASCTITYDAVGVSAVNTYDCSTPDQDDPETPENENAPYYRAEGYNQALCGAEADFSQGITIGAGINPDFPIECDPDTKLCLLRGPFRSGATNL